MSIAGTIPNKPTTNTTCRSYPTRSVWCGHVDVVLGVVMWLAALGKQVDKFGLVSPSQYDGLRWYVADLNSQANTARRWTDNGNAHIG